MTGELFPQVRRRHVLIVCSVYYLIQIFGMLAFQLRWSRDVAIFGSFWEAGKHVDYALHPLVWVTKEGFAETNLNPPALFPLFQLFALLDPQIGQSVWLFVSAAIYFACVWSFREHVTRAQLFWLLTVPIVYTGIGLGQIYVLMFALGLGIWWLIKDNRPIATAILVGILVAMKPNFAIWGLIAFAAGHFRPAIVAGLVALALSALPAALYGPDIYHQWLAAAALDHHGQFPHDVSLWGYFTRSGIPGAVIAIALAVIALLGWAFRRKPSLHDLTPVAFMAGVLCSPMAWIDYILVAVPFMVERPWRVPMLIAAFILYATPLAGNTVHAAPVIVWLASTLYLTPVIIMLAHFLIEASRSPTADVPEPSRSKRTSPHAPAPEPSGTGSAALQTDNRLRSRSSGPTDRRIGSRDNGPAGEPSSSRGRTTDGRGEDAAVFRPRCRCMRTAA